MADSSLDDFFAKKDKGKKKTKSKITPSDILAKSTASQVAADGDQEKKKKKKKDKQSASGATGTEPNDNTRVFRVLYLSICSISFVSTSTKTWSHDNVIQFKIDAC